MRLIFNCAKFSEKCSETKKNNYVENKASNNISAGIYMLEAIVEQDFFIYLYYWNLFL